MASEDHQIDDPRQSLLSDVFHALPAALLVVSETRRIVTWNTALTSLLGSTVDEGATCCDVFGCGLPGSALDGACITEVALTQRDGTHEHVIELPATQQKVAIAARVVPHAAAATVLLQIRSVTEPASTATRVSEAPSTIIFRTLGDTVLETPDGDVRGGWLDQRTGRLLKYLAANRTRSVHADVIAEALWPHGRTDSTNKVRHYVHELRDRLEPGRDRYAQSEFIVARNGGYQLNLERMQVDADQFERKARAGLSGLARGDRERALESLGAAMDLYGGDFLPTEPYEDWAIAERERLFDLAGQALRALAAGLADPAHAAIYLERLAEMEPLDPDVQREMICAWLRQGRRTRAIRRYRTLQSRFMREFGEPVTFDLAELARSERASPSGARHLDRRR